MVSCATVSPVAWSYSGPSSANAAHTNRTNRSWAATQGSPVLQISRCIRDAAIRRYTSVGRGRDGRRWLRPRRVDRPPGNRRVRSRAVTEQRCVTGLEPRTQSDPAAEWSLERDAAEGPTDASIRHSALWRNPATRRARPGTIERNTGSLYSHAAGAAPGAHLFPHSTYDRVSAAPHADTWRAEPHSPTLAEVASIDDGFDQAQLPGAPRPRPRPRRAIMRCTPRGSCRLPP